MRILIVDADATQSQSLATLLSGAGFAAETVADAPAALARALAERFDLVLCDLRSPGMDGLTFLRRYRADGGSGLVVMMAAMGGEGDAIEAMREGAFGYLVKPFHSDEVVLMARKAAERNGLLREVEALRASVGAEALRADVVAESKAMRSVVELASRVAAHDTTVLITGENGTGKELIARSIHHASPRRDGPFVAAACAGMPETLLESELFGHLKDAFPGATHDRAGLLEAAEQGTLFLDEVGEIPPGLQAKLFRVLEENAVRRLGARDAMAVNARVIAASAQPLDAMVARGEFREDLYYRLNVVQLRVPPLRERPEDVAALVTHFVRQAAERVGRTISITPGALVALSDHPWPGNVRELRNAIERAAVLSPAGRLDLEAFQLGPASENGHGMHSNGNGNGNGNGHHGPVMPDFNGTYLLKPQVEQLERMGIRRALDASGGNRRDAARLLGVSLRTLFYKLRRYQLE
jgi:two-component system response regulator AtoC